MFVHAHLGLGVPGLKECCAVQVAHEHAAGDGPWPASSPDEPSDSGDAGPGPAPRPPHRSPTPGAPPCSGLQSQGALCGNSWVLG